MKAEDLVVGRKVRIINGPYAGKLGIISDFHEEGELIEVRMQGTNKICGCNLKDLKLIDPFQTAFRKNENQNKKSNMKNLVFESLDELFESKKKVAEKREKKEDKPKPTNPAKEKAKAEKKKPVKVDQGKKEKYEQAIKALEAELAKAKKPGAFKTTAQKNAKIGEIREKITAWKAKLADLK